MTQEEVRAGAATTLSAYRIPFTPTPSCKYLVGLLLVADDDWAAVVCNLRWAQQKWEWLKWMLGREGVDAQALGMFYLEVFQEVLSYSL